MDYANYLKTYQEIPYKIFKNYLKNNNFFHAYLLSGPTGTPLLEIAKYLVKCLLSSTGDYLYEENIISKRIDDGNYMDFILIDGKKDQIKIDNIRDLETKFSQSATESLGIKVYIINMVENMAPDATNALLKFLEEPDQNTFAFLTTENEYRVLPTILSRTEIIHFSPLDQNKLIEECLSLSIDKKNAEILSFFYNDAETIKKETENEDYLEALNYLDTFIKYIPNKVELRVYTETQIIKKLKTKQSIRFFLDLLVVLFKESLRFSLNENLIMKESLEYIKLIVENVINIDDAILKLMNYRNELNYNLNTSLMFINLIEEIFGA